MEQITIPYEEADYDFWPGYWAVYVVRDEHGCFFCGSAGNPMWCASLRGARKFDAFSDGIASRERALGFRDKYCPKGKVLAFKRHEIYPERYK